MSVDFETQGYSAEHLIAIGKATTLSKRLIEYMVKVKEKNIEKIPESTVHPSWNAAIRVISWIGKIQLGSIYPEMDDYKNLDFSQVGCSGFYRHAIQNKNEQSYFYSTVPFSSSGSATAGTAVSVPLKIEECWTDEEIENAAVEGFLALSDLVNNKIQKELAAHA